MIPVTCRSLGADNLNEFLAFVDRDAFSDNPEWAGCYCVFHYLRDAATGDWDQRTALDNRRELIQRVGESRGHWIVAYARGQVVGWVDADMRPTLARAALRSTVRDRSLLCGPPRTSSPGHRGATP